MCHTFLRLVWPGESRSRKSRCFRLLDAFQQQRKAAINSLPPDTKPKDLGMPGGVVDRLDPQTANSVNGGYANINSGRKAALIWHYSNQRSGRT